jgi:hypothetical protein
MALFVLQILLMIGACHACYRLGYLNAQRQELKERLRMLNELQKALRD